MKENQQILDMKMRSEYKKNSKFDPEKEIWKCKNIK